MRAVLSVPDAIQMSMPKTENMTLGTGQGMIMLYDIGMWPMQGGSELVGLIFMVPNTDTIYICSKSLYSLQSSAT